MPLLPNWHPFFVHFPVALFCTALVCDLSLLARFRCAWLDRAAVLLYASAALGSGAAALTGKLAADAMETELTPEVNDAVAYHGDWAFFAVVSLFVVAAMRFDTVWRDRDAERPTPHRMRLVTIVVSMVVGAVVVHTAARGGELVYRYGVAVEERGIIPPRR